MLLQGNVVYRSLAVVVKECGRTLGVAVQQMSRGVAVGQSWQQLIYGNRRVPQVLHDTRTKRRQEEWEPDYDDGTGGEHIARRGRKMHKRTSSRRKSIDEIAGSIVTGLCTGL